MDLVVDALARDQALLGCGEKFSGGDIYNDVNLTKACSPYVILRNIMINGGTLSVEAGTVLLFVPQAGLFVYGGRLDVRGTVNDPVVFDSASDDPSPGDWPGLRFIHRPSSPSRLDSAVLRNCGKELGLGCVWISNIDSGNHVAFDGMTIERPADHGLVATGNALFSLAHSRFRAVPVDAYAVRLLAPQFSGIGPDNDFDASRVAIDGGVLVADTIWESPGTSVVVTRSISAGGQGTRIEFRLGAGLRLLFEQGAGIDLDAGYVRLVAAGTAKNPVVFTSSASAPAPGDWTGITVYGGQQVSGANMSNAVIEYAGAPAWGRKETAGILIYGNPMEASISDSIIRWNAGRGVYVDCQVDPPPNLTGTVFQGNATDVGQTGAVAENVGPGPRASAACVAGPQ